MGESMRNGSTASGLGFLLTLMAVGLLIASFSKETGPRAKWFEVLLLVVGPGLLLGRPQKGQS